MGSLYRRYPSKGLLAQRMRVMRMERFTDQPRSAMAKEHDPWAAFVDFLSKGMQMKWSDLFGQAVSWYCCW
jgi:hypothetical protein